MAAGVEHRRGRRRGLPRALAAHAGAALAVRPAPPRARRRGRAGRRARPRPGGGARAARAVRLRATRSRPCSCPARGSRTWPAMGDERQHARFTLVTGGGALPRGRVRTPPSVLGACGDEPHDVAVRLERNQLERHVEPRILLRALCQSGAGAREALGEDARSGSALPPTARRGRSRGRRARDRPARRRLRRRGRRPADERRAGARRRRGRRGGASRSRRSSRASATRPLASVWDTCSPPIPAWPAVHTLVALDPPPSAAPRDALLEGRRRFAHLAPGARPRWTSRSPSGGTASTCGPLTDVYRALREGPGRRADDSRRPSARTGRHPRRAELCARWPRYSASSELVRDRAGAGLRGRRDGPHGAGAVAHVPACGSGSPPSRRGCGRGPPAPPPP